MTVDEALALQWPDWGKHRNKPLREILEEDPSYLTYQKKRWEEAELRSAVAIVLADLDRPKAEEKKADAPPEDDIPF